VKTTDYYNQRIETLKATIRRLQAEKRIAILREKEKAAGNGDAKGLLRGAGQRRRLLLGGRADG
jgi:hypothetical protein